MSLQEVPAPALPNLIAGLIGLLMGSLILVRRESIYKSTVRREKRWLGQSFSEFLERAQSPFWVGVAGVGGVIMGIVAISYAVWRFLNP